MMKYAVSIFFFSFQESMDAIHVNCLGSLGISEGRKSCIVAMLNCNCFELQLGQTMLMSAVIFVNGGMMLRLQEICQSSVLLLGNMDVSYICIYIYTHRSL